VDDAEALGVARRPLEVIEQRPDEVAAQVDALVDGVRDGTQVGLQIGAPGLVIDLTVHQPIFVRCAILGDVERRQRVVAMQPQQELREIARRHFPPHGRHRRPFPCRDPAPAGSRRHRVVEIDADEIERLGDEPRIARAYARLIAANILEHVRGIAPE